MSQRWGETRVYQHTCASGNTANRCEVNDVNEYGLAAMQNPDDMAVT